MTSSLPRGLAETSDKRLSMYQQQTIVQPQPVVTPLTFENETFHESDDESAELGRVENGGYQMLHQAED